MASDLRVVLPNRPGALLEACDILARAGIPLLGFAGDLRPGERWGYLHVLVDDGATAQDELEANGFEVTSTHEVNVLSVDKHPGALAEEIKRYSDAGKNIEVVYMSSAGEIVVATDDMQHQRRGVRMDDAG
ncbi:MAG TPA: amino acid-binding ACT domain-containing protein [Actinomycetota bacterium]|nr:amino acid-binding ACT domain-containing protein [Actinomycetota bacterium]